MDGELGGYAVGNLIVTPGDTYYLRVGVKPVVLLGAGADSFSWSPAPVMDGVPYTLFSVGVQMYILTGTNEFGCEGTDSVAVEVNEELIITHATAGEVAGGDGSIDITVSGGTPAYVFDWDNYGTGDYDDTEDLNGISGGTYVVSVKAAKNSTVNETIFVSNQLSVKALKEIDFNVFPNPTIDFVNINYPEVYGYEVLTADGKIVFNGKGSSSTLLRVEILMLGTYFIRLKINNAEQIVKLVKQ